MFKTILEGIKAYKQSFGLISKLGLWKYFSIPILISILTAVLIGFTAYTLSDNLGDYMMKIWPWEYGNTWAQKILSFIGGLIILILGLILYKHIVMALSAPFMSPVSEKIEAHLGITHVHRDTSFIEQLWRGIRINLRNLLRELLLTLPVLLLNFIPLIGSVVATGMLFTLQAYYAGFGNMDYTLERHYTYSESVAFVKKNRGIAIGNGIVFLLFLLVPVIGIILVLPMSVTAASLKTVELIKDETP